MSFLSFTLVFSFLISGSSSDSKLIARETCLSCDLMCDLGWCSSTVSAPALPSPCLGTLAAVGDGAMLCHNCAQGQAANSRAAFCARCWLFWVSPGWLQLCYSGGAAPGCLGRAGRSAGAPAHVLLCHQLTLSWTVQPWC